MDTIDNSFYTAIHSVTDLDFIVDGKHPITLDKIKQTSAPDGLISDPVMNGYLHLLTTDIKCTNSTRMPFHIFDTLLADHIRNADLDGLQSTCVWQETQATPISLGP